MMSIHIKSGKYLQKSIIITSMLLISTHLSYAQQFSLYNSRTLYDSFENPSQKAFQVDSSRRFAFNFFIPSLSANGTFSGPAKPAFKSLIYDGVFNGRDIEMGSTKPSILSLHSNNYIAMFRFLKDVKNYQEMGLSWQVRNDMRLKVSNETFAIFDDYRILKNISDPNNFTIKDIFNNTGYNQAYHQFSFTYRQNYSKRFAVGAKFSVLSGIAYSSININESELTKKEFDSFDISIRGNLRSNFKFDNFQTEMLLPNFKNAGFSVTASAGYKLRHGWTLMGNLKDLGFIRWNKNSYEYNFDTGKITISDGSDQSADDRLADSLDSKINSSATNRSYLSATNGKAELLIHKDFGNYKPNLILSKSVYYGGGDIAMIHNYHYKDYVFTGSTNYNTNGILQVGGQFMIKSPNAEFYLGSDQLFKTVEVIKNFSSDRRPYSSRYTGASFYIGFGLKFGTVLEHRHNASSTPGFRKNPISAFVKKILGKKD